MTNKIKLPPIDKHDHPECRVMTWTELELEAIKQYATQAVTEDRAQRDAQHLAELRAYELTVANLREQLAQRGEPVAWKWRFADGDLSESPFESRSECERDAVGYDGEAIPLYTHPQAPREQLAQRECKPLTLDEWNRHPYTLALMRSMSEDYVPKTDAQQAVPPKSTSYDEHPYTYASTQATTCAGCGKYKHTPLRIDAMDGYVCLTCIDQKLGSVLGEFGYQAPQAPMTDAEMREGRERIFSVDNPYCPCDSKTFMKVTRYVEAHHGIKEQP